MESNFRGYCNAYALYVGLTLIRTANLKKASQVSLMSPKWLSNYTNSVLYRNQITLFVMINWFVLYEVRYTKNIRRSLDSPWFISAFVGLSYCCISDADCIATRCPSLKVAFCHSSQCHCHYKHECFTAADCAYEDCFIFSKLSCENNHCHCTLPTTTNGISG